LGKEGWERLLGCVKEIVVHTFSKQGEEEIFRKLEDRGISGNTWGLARKVDTRYTKSGEDRRLRDVGGWIEIHEYITRPPFLGK